MAYNVHLGDMDAVENLVKSMNEPGASNTISEINATLTQLQKSDRGWQVADALIKSTDQNVQFFAVGTFIVKLNTDSAALSEEQSRELLSTLVASLQRILWNSKRNNFVTRKLCSALATYFLRPVCLSSWSQCIFSLISCFWKQDLVLDDALNQTPPIWDILPQLDDTQLMCALEFVKELADQAKKLTQATDIPIHTRLVSNVQDVEAILQFAFVKSLRYMSMTTDATGHAETIEFGEKLSINAMQTFVAWVFYAQTEFQSTPEKVQYLRTVSEFVFNCLPFHVEDMLELFAEILENYPKFFDSEQQAKLWNEIKSDWAVEIIESFDEESVTLARIIVAYAQILLDSGNLYTQLENPRNQEVINVLRRLLEYPHVAAVDDEVAPLVTDFFSGYISTIDDQCFEYQEDDVKPEWLSNAKSIMFLVVAALYRKICYPGPHITKDWDNDSKRAFKNFRVDVSDLIGSAYEYLGVALLDQFINSIAEALQSSEWYQLEAGLFCLASIAEGIPDTSDGSLDRLLSLPLFSTMADRSDIPAVTRRSAVELVAGLDDFFLRNVGHLPQVLRFLFTALGQPSVAQSAAKSFASLCSECRKSLTSELEAFFQMYQQFLAYPTAEESTKSKVLEGIAAIVQALDTDDQKRISLEHLFQYVAQDGTAAIRLAETGTDFEQGQVLALTSLKCLGGIGKSLQADDNNVIDLESEQVPSTFWTQGQGKGIQSVIIEFVNRLTGTFGSDPEVIEAACLVLRSGYKETAPGPFVLRPSATVDFLSQCNIQTPRLPYVLDTICIFVTGRKKDTSQEFQAESQRLMLQIIRIMRELGHPSTDPEVSVGCIEVIQKIINTNAAILMSSGLDDVRGIFSFSIECLESPEILPKRAAAHLWHDVFALAGNMGSPHKGTAQDITEHFGAHVTVALINNLCGEVEPSLVDNLFAPLRRMILTDRCARANIAAALMQAPVLLRAQEHGVDVEPLKRRFLEGAIRNARSTRSFKESLKEFYLNCKKLIMQLPQ